MESREEADRKERNTVNGKEKGLLSRGVEAERQLTWV